jgi:hypothetical protein
MAELHIVGQLVGAADFPLPSAFCKFSFEAGSNFRLLQGQTAGQTQCDMPAVRRASFFSVRPILPLLRGTPASRVCRRAPRSPCISRVSRRRARWRSFPTLLMCTML